MTQISYVRREMVPEKAPPPSTTGPIGWVRANLFDGWMNSALTILSLVFIYWVLREAIAWLWSPTWSGTSLHECREMIEAAGKEHGACWGVIRERWPQLLFGFYPDHLRLRPTLAFALLFVALIPVLFNMISRRMNWLLLVLVLFGATFFAEGSGLMIVLRVLLGAALAWLVYTVVTTNRADRAEEIAAGARRLPNPLIFTALYVFLMPWLLWGGSIWNPVGAALGFAVAWLALRFTEEKAPDGIATALGIFGGVLAFATVLVIAWFMTGILASATVAFWGSVFGPDVFWLWRIVALVALVVVAPMTVVALVTTIAGAPAAGWLTYRGVVTHTTMARVILAVLAALFWWMFLMNGFVLPFGEAGWQVGGFVDLFRWAIPLGIEPVESRLFGGLLLSVTIGVTAIVISLPLGIVLALGRQSDLMIVKSLSVMFIEFIRGVPLITLLFVASVLLNIFMPPGTNFDIILRVIIMATLFAAAYMAEVVRGGLAALPRGQYEAADALGLDYWKAQRLIIMPQALKISIPGIVSTFIGLFKDTTLVSIIGLLDPLGLSNAIRADGAWHGVVWELYGFIAVLFFIFTFSMSRYSMYLERRLRTDHR